MAKKAKRKVSTVEQTATSTTAPVESTVSSSMRSAANRRSMTAEEFNPDYSYVVKDLKRIGTLAAIFFVVLIVLSFIIR